MSVDFDPYTCPKGIAQEKELERAKDKLDMAIQRLEEHIDNVKADVNKGFAVVDKHFEEVDNHFDAVDKRFDKLENQFNNLKHDLPDQIDERVEVKINSNNGRRALNIIRWVIVTAGGSVLIALLTKLTIQLFKLG